MSYDAPQLVISSSPFVKRGVDTPAIMRHVMYALAPAVVAAVYFFGLSALLVMTACVAGAVLSEYVFAGRGPLRENAIMDGSAAVNRSAAGHDAAAGPAPVDGVLRRCGGDRAG